MIIWWSVNSWLNVTFFFIFFLNKYKWYRKLDQFWYILVFFIMMGSKHALLIEVESRVSTWNVTWGLKERGPPHWLACNQSIKCYPQVKILYVGVLQHLCHSQLIFLIPIFFRVPPNKWCTTFLPNPPSLIFVQTKQEVR